MNQIIMPVRENLAECPEWMMGLTEFDEWPIIGWRALTERVTDEPCDLGCLAVGSSPHFHTKRTGYQLVTTHGIYEFRLDGTCVRASTLHAIPPC